ncbi:hypothetical protein LMH87_002260 [Akanthomyces muscarius]|uniref:Uncharacterized protein n=1 Tax=Akanthomyces muscarius TaxID=2231603 RepID=A0A9W8Q7C7_AKAMU|nr:hypothetical protein LMH87_002260 [Akanthomyces muscarius]KAJ4147754.1 hypothetical protein LMH87_002260 [Akanthomyces muscarius]
MQYASGTFEFRGNEAKQQRAPNALRLERDNRPLSHPITSRSDGENAPENLPLLADSCSRPATTARTGSGRGKQDREAARHGGPTAQRGVVALEQ